MAKKSIVKKEKQLLLENEELRSRLAEAEETLNSIRNGGVDAIVVQGSVGEKIFSLTSAETPYRIIIEEMDEGATVLSADGTILYCNQRFAELVSIPLERIVGSNFIRFVAESDKPKFNILMQSGLKGKSNGEIAYLINDKNLKYFHLSVNALPPDAIGEVCVMIADITELKQKEDELRNSHETLEHRVIERTAELDKTIVELEASRSAIVKMMEDAVEAKSTLEIVNKKLRIQINERDLAKSQKEAALTELKASEEKFRKAFFTSPDSVAITRAVDGMFISINDGFKQITGYTDEEVLGKCSLEVDIWENPEDRKTIVSDLKSKGFAKNFEARFRKKNGDIIYGLMSASIIELNGMPHILNITRDITERKQAENLLRTEHHRFNTLISNLYAGVLTVSEDGMVELVNQAFCDLFNLTDTPADLCGLTSPEMIKKIIGFYASPDYALSRIQEIVAQGKPVRNEEIAMKDGKFYMIDYVPIEVDGKKIGRIWHHQDITARKQNENDLLLSKQHSEILLRTLQGIINSTVDLIFSLDTQYRYTSFNQNHESLMKRIYGCDIKIGYSILDCMFVQDDRKAAKKNIDLALKGERVQEESYSGDELLERLYFEVTHNPILDSNRNIIGVSVFAKDITERKRSEDNLKTSEVRYRRLFEAARDGILILNSATGMIVDVNPFLIEMLGYSYEQFLGKPIWELGFFKDIAANKDNFLELQQKEYIRYEDLPLETSDGRRIHVEFTSNIYFVNNIKVFQCNIRDISERKLAEDLIRKLNAELEQRVIERTAELESANKDLEAFSYSISHDLRAPLRAINGFSQILVNRHIESFNDEGRHYLENIILASDRMSRLIDDILKYSRLGRKSLSFSSVSLKELFDRILLDYEEIISANKTEIIITQDLPEIESDHTLLNLILSNLINNAIKYHKKNVPNKIEIDFEQNDAWYILRVKDNGIGIDPEFNKKIFDVFQRLHSEDEYPGTGIGLAIVKKCADLLGAEVYLESSVINEGSTFLIKLPKE